MKFVAEPPPTLQPLGQATTFVAEPPPTLQPEYLLGKAIRPVVRLMSDMEGGARVRASPIRAGVVAAVGSGISAGCRGSAAGGWKLRRRG